MTTLLFLSLAFASAATLEPKTLAGNVQTSERQQAAAATATATTQTTSVSTTPARDRQICRRQARIGTLAGFESICHTEAEWRAIARGSQASWGQLQGTFGATNDRGRGPACLPNGIGC
jgi:hypothetical protein